MIIKNTSPLRIKGFSLIEVVVALLILTGLAVAVAPKYTQQTIPLDMATQADNEIAEIKAAANAYYMENRAWPSSTSELITQGYLPGDGVSPFGTGYAISTNGQNMVVSVDTNRRNVANMLAAKVPFGKIDSSGEVVSSEMGQPTRDAIQSFYLARKAVPGCSDCNQLAPGTDLDINNNDLLNVGTLDAQNAQIENATITNAQIDELTTDEIVLGSNRITHAGDIVTIDAGTLQISGQLSIDGDLIGNGNNLTGFDRIQGNLGQFERIDADNGVVTSLSGHSLDFSTGTVDTLSGNQATFDTGYIAQLSGNSLNYNSGTIDTLSGDSMSFSTGTINQLSGDTLTYGTANINQGEFGQLYSTSAQTNSLTVNGHSSLNTVSANTADINAVNASVANMDEVYFNELSSQQLTAANAQLATVQATNTTTNFLTVGSFDAQNLRVTGSFSLGGTLTAENVNVSGQTTTDSINSNNSDLGTVSAQTVNVASTLTANRVSAQSFTSNSGQISTLSGDSANFNRVTANQYNGGAYYGTNFTTQVSSVNNNKSMIDQYIAKWQQCVSSGGCK